MSTLVSSLAGRNPSVAEFSGPLPQLQPVDRGEKHDELDAKLPRVSRNGENRMSRYCELAAAGSI